MNTTEIETIKFARALICDLHPSEPGYHACIEEAADALANLIDQNTDDQAQVLHLVTNA